MILGTDRPRHKEHRRSDPQHWHIIRSRPPSQPSMTGCGSNAPSYVVGETAHITVTGLSACASQEVMIGFFGPGASPVLTTTAIVEVDGTVATDIAITFGGFSNFAGAAAECIPGGSVLSADLVSLSVLDPPAAHVRADAPSYAVGETAIMTGVGIRECVGEDVKVGFFTVDAQPILVVTTRVEDDGTLSAAVQITFGGFGGYAGVEGDCLPDGPVLYGELIPIIFVDPPNTGTGLRPSHQTTSQRLDVLAATALVAIASLLVIRACRGARR